MTFVAHQPATTSCFRIGSDILVCAATRISPFDGDVGSDKPADADLEVGTYEEALRTAKEASSKKACSGRFYGVSSMLCNAIVQTEL